MSGEEICGAETSTAKVQEQSLANREGDEFIRVLSAIASAADRNYTPVADTGKGHDKERHSGDVR